MVPYQVSRLVHGGKPGGEPLIYSSPVAHSNCRAGCSTDAIHAPFVAGIAGSASQGAYSVALSGGYDDDVDLGYALSVMCSLEITWSLTTVFQYIHRLRLIPA